MSSTHHSLQYIFFGLLLIVVSLIWTVLYALQITIPPDFIIPFGLMVLGLALISAALIWHRLTRS